MFHADTICGGIISHKSIECLYLEGSKAMK